MKRKGIVCLLLAMVMLCASYGVALAEGEGADLAPDSAATVGEVKLSIATVDASVDDEVVISIDLANAATVDSVQFNLNYDAAALEYVTDLPGQLFPAEYCVTNPDVAGCVRVAAASPYGLENDGSMLTVTFKVLTATGSAISFSDVKVSRVNADYTQNKSDDLDFFLLTTDGGVTVGGLSLPAPVATPWVAPTPPPTPEPTPEPSAEPTPEPAIAATATETPLPEQRAAVGSRSSMLRYILIAVVVLLVIAVVVIIVSSVQQKKKRRRKKKKQQAARQRERENYRDRDSGANSRERRYEREYDRDYERGRERSRERDYDRDKESGRDRSGSRDRARRDDGDYR